MKINPAQLAGKLQAGLAPIYLVHGDEPLQVGEAVDQIRKALAARGLDERLSFEASAGFDWSSLPAEAASLSLFGGGRLLELNLPTGRPGAEGAKVLKAMAASPVEGSVLLLRCGKLDAKLQKSAWMKAIEQAGVVVQVYSPGADQLPGWVGQRARSAGLELSPEACELLAEKTEGNLLACVQELEKLALLYPQQPQLGVEEVLQGLFDSARYNVFSLVDSALSGDGPRTLRVITALQAEGMAVPLVIWALGRELRSLLAMARKVAAGTPPATAVAGNRGVWGNRKAVVIKALERLNEPRLLALLRYLARIDRVAKGQIRERRDWDELQRLSLRLAGVRI